jgi:hypothetical protein
MKTPLGAVDKLREECLGWNFVFVRSGPDGLYVAFNREMDGRSMSMEDDVRKHFRGIRILVTLALLAACISFAFSYVLFKEVNIPLERIRTHELNLLEGKVDYLMSSRLDGRLDVELQAALLTMRDVAAQTSGDLQEQAKKALEETKALLKMLRQQR